MFHKHLFLLQETGEVLMPQDLKKKQTYGGKDICFENDEVTEIKEVWRVGSVEFSVKKWEMLNKKICGVFMYLKP